jgi:hypothetical protein
MTDKREAQIARIRALMAKTTQNGCTEAEAAAAAEAVDRLLAAYEIDLDEVSLRAQEVVRLDLELLHHRVRHVAMAVGNFTDCKVWSNSDAGDICFLGLEIDTEIAEYLMLLFKRAMDREAAGFVLMNLEYAEMNATGQQSMLASFEVGMAARLRDRLGELKSKRDFAQRRSGTDLVVAKAPMIAAAFGTLGIVLGRGAQSESVRHQGAYLAGRAAADTVGIHQGVRTGHGTTSKIAAGG